MRIGLFSAVWLPLIALLGGCTTPPYCDEVKACGGDFTSGAKDLGGGVVGKEWVAGPSDACSDQVPAVREPPQLSLIPARPAGQRAVEPSTVDWCAGLKISGKGDVVSFNDGWLELLVKYRGWYPSVALYTARLEIDATNFQHTLDTTQLVAEHYDLPPTCLYAQGVVLTCAELAPRLQKFIEGESGLKSLASVNTTGFVYGMGCADAAAGGCTCDYNMSVTSTTKGPWVAGAGKVNFYDADAAPVAPADYCASDTTFDLAGTDGGDLFNRNMLKTLRFKPPSCNDGVQSKSLGEAGVDCGGSCPNACPTP